MQSLNTKFSWLGILFILCFSLIAPCVNAAESSTKKVVLVTGASRGIGKAIALQLARTGHYIVYAGMRQTKGSELAREKTDLDSLHLIALDVTNQENCFAVVQQILEVEGRLDVLINNAGQGLFGPAETIQIEEAKALFDVNLFGPLRLIQAVLPSMRERNEGLIINVSSIVGVRPGICWDLYSSSKFALEGLSESLATTLQHWNIHVVLLQPGPVATEFPQYSTTFGSRFDGRFNPYQIVIEKSRQRMQNLLQTGQPPSEVALLVQRIIETKEPDLRYQTSDFVKQVVSERHIDPTGNKPLFKQIKLLEDLWKP